ncbi:MAG: DUF1269 domain-containing protein [Gammaproteobacteria bacterium]
MNRRLYFVLPDIDTARRVMNDLLLARIEERRMHFLGRYGADLEDLPEAGTLQKTDILHGMFLGAVAGAMVGTIVAVALMAYPALVGAEHLGAPTLAMGIAAGMVFGMWVSGTLIGTSTPSQRLRRFDEAFENNRILLMVDVPAGRVETIRNMVHERHPTAEDHGIETLIPAFP